MLRIRDASNTSRSITDIKFRDVGNILHDLSFMKVRDASGVLRTIWQRLNVTADAFVSGYGNSNAPITITTNSPNPVVFGGTAPFTYSWSSVPGWTVLYPTQLNTSFRRPGVANGDSYDETFTLTVTDASGNVATVDVQAHVENLGGTA